MLAGIKEKLRRLVNNEYERRDWVKSRLAELPEGARLLDAGCGSQPYRRFCSALEYSAQDFGEFEADEKESLTGCETPYEYGKLDYVGDIWDVAEEDGAFGAILCTEVLEHIPYPEKTIREFARLLGDGGRLILTFPCNCLRHMDPYFYSSGYSDRFIRLMLEKYGFSDIRIEPVGSYHQWLMVETFRSIRQEGLLALLFLAPAFVYHYRRQRKPSEAEVNTLCIDYHVTAVRRTGAQQGGTAE